MSASTETETSGTETQETQPDKPVASDTPSDPWKDADMSTFGGEVEDVPRIQRRATGRKGAARKRKQDKPTEGKPEEGAEGEAPKPELTPEQQEAAQREAEEMAEVIVGVAEDMFLLTPVEHLGDVFTENELERVRGEMRLAPAERSLLVKPGAKVLMKYMGSASPEYALLGAAALIYLSRQKVAAKYGAVAEKRRKQLKGLNGAAKLSSEASTNAPTA